jgi:hypothetical protein
MSAGQLPPSPSNHDADFGREQVVYIDGGDTTVRPVTAASLRIRERDREQIAELLTWARRQQEELDADRRGESKPDESNPR